MSEGLTFPVAPVDGETISFQFTHTGGSAESNVITRTWSWNESRSAWVSNNSGIGGGGGIGTQGPTGPTGVVGIISGGSISISNPPSLIFEAGTNITIEGTTSDSGITFTFSAAGGNGANPEGPDGSVQFNDSNSLSGIAEVGVFTNEQLNPTKGLSANFLQYSESLSSDSDSNLINTEKTLDLEFGKYNIFTVPNIRLGEGATFTVQGLTPMTGASLSLILGHTGASGSKIQFSENMDIYWANGGPAFGDLGGQTAYIYPSSNKKYDIIYFFSDGTDIFGNHQRNFKKTI